MPTVFFSYSHADEALRDQLEKQLALLKRQGVIETWHDRRIGAGSEIDHAIGQQMEAADIILLLVSADFLASDYCYDREMARAMERHQQGAAVVIPVILRACDWHGAPFGKLNATPPDGKPVTQWADRDQSFLEVAKAVRAAAEKLGGQSPAPHLGAAGADAVPVIAGPRSSNLRLAKTFTERDMDAFRLESFDYIARYFEGSLAELGNRNPGIEGVFRRVDAGRFFAAVYRDGRAEARCTIFFGDRGFVGGIGYVQGESTESNSYNESLTVQADDQALYLTSMGMRFHGGQRDQKLSQEGAAEQLWSMFIEPLQNS